MSSSWQVRHPISSGFRESGFGRMPYAPYRRLIIDAMAIRPHIILSGAKSPITTLAMQPHVYLLSPNNQKWLEPSKQWVHTLHLGKPMALMSVSMVLNFSEVRFRRLRISSTMARYSGESVVA